jgi:hypothetical protein
MSQSQALDAAANDADVNGTYRGPLEPFNFKPGSGLQDRFYIRYAPQGNGGGNSVRMIE